MEKHIQNLIFLKKDYYGAEVLRSLPGKDAFDQCRQGSAVCGMVTAVDEEIMGVTRLFIMCCPMDQEKVGIFKLLKYIWDFNSFLAMFRLQHYLHNRQSSAGNDTLKDRSAQNRKQRSGLSTVTLNFKKSFKRYIVEYE